MSDSITIARPYAKAIFEHALAKKQLSTWSFYLQVLAAGIEEEQVSDFITNPATLPEQHAELLLALKTEVPSEDAYSLANFIKLLAVNGRLLLLPEIFLVFDELRADQEKTLEVTVTSYSKLSKEQQQALANALKKRLEREVTLNVVIDKTLIGGALIKAGDLVIDGSIRGMLHKLRSTLVA